MRCDGSNLWTGAGTWRRRVAVSVSLELLAHDVINQHWVRGKYMNGDLCFLSELKAVSEHFKRYFSLVLQEGGCHFVLESSSCCCCCCCFSPKGRKRGEGFIPNIRCWKQKRQSWDQKYYVGSSEPLQLVEQHPRSAFIGGKKGNLESLNRWKEGVCNVVKSWQHGQLTGSFELGEVSRTELLAELLARAICWA